MRRPVESYEEKTFCVIRTNFKNLISCLKCVKQKVSLTENKVKLVQRKEKNLVNYIYIQYICP